MGFTKDQPRIYFKLKNGKCVINVKEENLHNFQDFVDVASSTKHFKNDAGVEVVDINLDRFSGHITGIDAETTDYGKVWNVTFTDEEGKRFIWSTYYDGLLFQGFINSLLSIKSKIELITLKPWLGNDNKGNPQTKLTVLHNEEKLSWKYKPEELPEIKPKLDEDGEVETDSKGNIIYNKKKRMQWLLASVLELRVKLGISSEVAPEAPKNGNGNAPKNGNGTTAKKAAKVEFAEESDIPF
jgi:hypothetical protein